MRFYKWLIVIAIPLTLIMVTVRLVTLPWYPVWEYSRPGFPEDPLDMPDADRLRLAKTCIRFLNVPHDTNILASLRFEDGSVVFIERELDHMDDVKIVYDRMTTAVGLVLLIAITFSIIMIRKGEVLTFYRALWHGGLLTLSILVFVGLWMLVGFDVFFSAFHGIFFSEGTWIFYTTDALIRLFPLRFWQDAGMGIAGAVIIFSLCLMTFSRWRSKDI